jgi:uncharacterized membrane protein YagU involved in acid resistance
MINSISLFTSITTTISTKVKLPNGQFALVTHIGTVQISAHLTLTNILCVPSFSFNLLSVSKLVQSFNFSFLFFANYCVIQNLTPWMTIGVGREANGLYYFFLFNDCCKIHLALPSPKTELPQISQFLHFHVPEFFHAVIMKRAD